MVFLNIFVHGNLRDKRNQLLLTGYIFSLPVGGKHNSFFPFCYIHRFRKQNAKIC